MISAVTFCTNGGASGGTVRCVEAGALAWSGTVTSTIAASASSIAATFASTSTLPRFPYASTTDSLIARIALSTSITSASAKKQVCMIVLIRRPIECRAATS